MKRILSKGKFAIVLIGGMLAILLSACGLLTQKHLHGEKLLKLSDDQLFEAVYFQNLDLVESYEDEETALSQISAARRTVYILSIFDMEYQCGGLCQFFVNSSRALGPYVDECLESVGAEEHRRLLSAFITDNAIDLRSLASCQIDDIAQYEAQLKRYDFDAFDNAFGELPELQEYIVAYIKSNISEF